MDGKIEGVGMTVVSEDMIMEIDYYKAADEPAGEKIRIKSEFRHVFENPIRIEVPEGTIVMVIMLYRRM